MKKAALMAMCSILCAGTMTNASADTSFTSNTEPTEVTADTEPEVTANQKEVSDEAAAGPEDGAAAERPEANAPLGEIKLVTVALNGQITEIAAYNIDDTNYFKLRDIAALLSGTAKRFSVSWDEQTKAVSIIQGAEYQAVGGELNTSVTRFESAELNKRTIVYKDWDLNYIEAYNVDGNNYFKLREMAELAGIEVAWNDELKIIEITV